MQNNNLFKKIFFLVLLFPIAILAQESSFEEKNLGIDTSLSKSRLLIDQEKEDGLANILLGNKATSLMYNKKENRNIERVFDSLKNNEIYTLEEGETEEEDLSKDDLFLAQEELDNQNLDNEKSYIYLAALLFFSEENWIVWINDLKITSKDNNKDRELYIDSISKSKVDIIWSLSLSKWKIISGNQSEIIPETNENNQIEIKFALQQNQTFILKSKNIVEGQAVIAAKLPISNSEEEETLDQF